MASPGREENVINMKHLIMRVSLSITQSSSSHSQNNVGLHSDPALGLLPPHLSSPSVCPDVPGRGSFASHTRSALHVTRRAQRILAGHLEAGWWQPLAYVSLRHPPAFCLHFYALPSRRFHLPLPWLASCAWPGPLPGRSLPPPLGQASFRQWQLPCPTPRRAAGT